MLTIYPSSSSVNSTKFRSGSFFLNLGRSVGAEIIAYSSARAALLSGIRALGFGRDDEILVPPFLSHCVLSAIGRAGFPTREFSSRTKGILVYHQFGFPQALDEIDAVARSKGLAVINDCANSLFSRFRQRYVADWGDVTALSFSKFYACELGGGMIAHHPRIRQWAAENYQQLAERHNRKSAEAFDTLCRVRQNLADFDNRCALDGVYGQLPEIVSFPAAALSMLPGSVEQLEGDRIRRVGLWDLVRNRFPHLVPQAGSSDVVPFAIPLSLSGIRNVQTLVTTASSRLGVEIPILHFDFNCNMLNPDYRKALVLGCHSGWDTELVVQICDLVESA